MRQSYPLMHGNAIDAGESLGSPARGTDQTAMRLGSASEGCVEPMATRVRCAVITAGLRNRQLRAAASPSRRAENSALSRQCLLSSGERGDLGRRLPAAMTGESLFLQVLPLVNSLLGRPPPPIHWPRPLRPLAKSLAEFTIICRTHVQFPALAAQANRPLSCLVCWLATKIANDSFNYDSLQCHNWFLTTGCRACLAFGMRLRPPASNTLANHQRYRSKPEASSPLETMERQCPPHAPRQGSAQMIAHFVGPLIAFRQLGRPHLWRKGPFQECRRAT